MKKEKESLIFRGRTKNFSEGEFYCKDGCGLYNMRVSFIMRLQAARGFAGIPFLINSGSRCPKHNEAVGGKSDSWHLFGDAGDISIDPEKLKKYGVSMSKAEIVGCIVSGLLKAGFKRIIIYFDDKDLFIHVDDGNWKKDAPVKIWCKKARAKK